MGKNDNDVRIGGNHSRRMNELNVTCDGSELREILSDWWDEELYGLDQAKALGKISDILRNPEVNLPSIASKLRPRSDANPLDTILRTGILENEPLLEERIKEILESIQDPESAEFKTPEEAYTMIDFYFKEIVKSNNKNALQIERVEHDTESSFQLPNVKKFVLGEGTLNTKHLQEVKDSRLKLLIMQILENPNNKRGVRQVVSQFKKDISAYKELEENIILEEKVKAEQKEKKHFKRRMKLFRRRKKLFRQRKKLRKRKGSWKRRKSCLHCPN